MNIVRIICTDFGNFPAPLEMIEAAKGVKWRKHDRSWPDMRTKAGRRWVEMFRAFSEQKRQEWMAQSQWTP
jgi:hypothetical protein